MFISITVSCFLWFPGLAPFIFSSIYPSLTLSLSVVVSWPRSTEDLFIDCVIIPLEMCGGIHNSIVVHQKFAFSLWTIKLLCSYTIYQVMSSEVNSILFLSFSLFFPFFLFFFFPLFFFLDLAIWSKVWSKWSGLFIFMRCLAMSKGLAYPK